MSVGIENSFSADCAPVFPTQSRPRDFSAKHSVPIPVRWEDIVSELFPTKILDAATLFSPHEPMFPPVNAAAVLEDLAKRNLLDKVVPSPLKLTRDDLKRRRSISALTNSPSDIPRLKIFDDANRARARSPANRSVPASPLAPTLPEPRIIGTGSVNHTPSSSSASPAKIDVTKLYSALKDSQRSTLEKSYFRLFAAFGLPLMKQEDTRSILKKVRFYCRFSPVLVVHCFQFS
eukprot:TRINITY_DN14618_c0_g1_i1.p1 TRINITY_DN14618_c0_g1~~TRINITY_DN14618_c0_g1_i1.p1  ORF type:complete len:233 (+),score=44.13 TRINITY_DN14618_c0_g1_i1:233-931(+)